MLSSSTSKIIKKKRKLGHGQENNEQRQGEEEDYIQDQINKCKKQISTQMYREALSTAKTLAKILKSDPSQLAFVLELQIVCQEALGRWGESLRIAREMIAVLPRSPKGYLRVGKAMRKLGRHSDALRVYERGRRESPQHQAEFDRQAASVRRKLGMGVEEGRKAVDLSGLGLDVLNLVMKFLPFQDRAIAYTAFDFAAKHGDDGNRHNKNDAGDTASSAKASNHTFPPSKQVVGIINIGNRISLINNQKTYDRLIKQHKLLPSTNQIILKSITIDTIPPSSALFATGSTNTKCTISNCTFRSEIGYRALLHHPFLILQIVDCEFYFPVRIAEDRSSQQCKLLIMKRFNSHLESNKISSFVRLGGHGADHTNSTDACSSYYAGDGGDLASNAANTANGNYRPFEETNKWAYDPQRQSLAILDPLHSPSRLLSVQALMITSLSQLGEGWISRDSNNDPQSSSSADSAHPSLPLYYKTIRSLHIQGLVNIPTLLAHLQKMPVIQELSLLHPAIFQRISPSQLISRLPSSIRLVSLPQLGGVRREDFCALQSKWMHLRIVGEGAVCERLANRHWLIAKSSL